MGQVRAPLAILIAGVFAVATASAAPVTFDVAGHASVNTLSDFAPPPLPYFVATAIAPSSVTLELDQNGDGTPGDVALVGGTLNFSTTVTFGSGALGSITTHEVLTVPAGGLGALTGDQILWGPELLQPALDGTYECEGAICSIIGVPPIGPLGALAASSNVFLPYTEPITLGTWLLSPDHGQITGSARMVLTRALPGGTPPAGTPTRWLVLGDTDLGFQVPEPAAAALVLAALGALAVRQRALTDR